MYLSRSQSLSVVTSNLHWKQITAYVRSHNTTSGRVRGAPAWVHPDLLPWRRSARDWRARGALAAERWWGAEEMRAFGIRFPRALRRPFLAGRVSFLKARAVDASICPGRCFSVTLFTYCSFIITREHSAHLLLFVAFFIALHFIAACLSWVHFASCAMNSYKLSRWKLIALDKNIFLFAIIL